MKNQINFQFVLIMLVFFGNIPFQSKAQLRFDVYSIQYHNVTSYNGYDSGVGSHTFHFSYNGTSINIPNWSVTARVKAPIVPESGNNVSGQPFPADKIGFRFTHDDAQSVNLSSIGASTALIPLQQSNEVFMIRNSKAPIFFQSQYPGYMQFRLNYTLQIAGGDYLDLLKNKDPYNIIVYGLPVQYTVYNEKGEAILSRDVYYRIQINNTLTGGSTEPDYSISIMENAKNGVLEFISYADYKRGVTAQYPDGLRINSITDFEVNIKALDPEFKNAANNTLDLSVLNIQLQPSTDASKTYSNPILPISTSAQTYLIGTANKSKKKPQYFNIQYNASFDQQKLSTIKSGAYQTSIIYVLTPR
ncbi:MULTISPECIES: hypothetical protein [unclassified Sphingobacterium]|uniref:hypothetical protein n=1 Tax=unclassified Sphingobacterium TaxID=2609468 RepID=UPI0025D4D74E|nr:MULTISPECIES: hypothetical protein [unclassified Sphingobacterium]